MTPHRGWAAVLVLLAVLAPADASLTPADGVAPAPPGINPHTGLPDPNSGVEMLGRPAPGWSFDRWVRGGPLTPGKLRGKVVLIRWWTDGCHYCRTTLPVIEALRREHPRDLVVVGAYHPKPPRPVKDSFVLETARTLGFGGPIAVDLDWETLGRYWLDADPERAWTSVSFLIDREGVVRWVHGGGEYHPSTDSRHARCDAQHRELLAALERALTSGAGERSSEAHGAH